jgi:hypothetical protein
MVLFANTQPYKKAIVFEKITKPTLVKVKLDNEIYQHTTYDYADVRLMSNRGVDGYFIKPNQAQRIDNQQTLTATSYDRENAKLIYLFKEPFEIETITLNIEDRNFESTVDVYADGKLVRQNDKIFDYTQETGNRNFTVNLPKVKAKEVSIVYHLDKTTSFYKKYKNVKELSQYLTIKSVTFSNNNAIKPIFEITTMVTASILTKEKQSQYLFRTQGIPSNRIELDVVEKNFKRSGAIYASENGETWHHLKSFFYSNSTLNQEHNETIELENRSEYLKLVIDNQDNQALNIRAIKLLTLPNYLYFIANPNETYMLYFGDKNLTKPTYEVESLVDSEVSFITGNFGNMEQLDVTQTVKKISFFEEHKEMLFMLVILLALGTMAYIAFGLLKRTRV